MFGTDLTLRTLMAFRSYWFVGSRTRYTASCCACERQIIDHIHRSYDQVDHLFSFSLSCCACECQIIDHIHRSVAQSINNLPYKHLPTVRYSRTRETMPR